MPTQYLNYRTPPKRVTITPPPADILMVCGLILFLMLAFVVVFVPTFHGSVGEAKIKAAKGDLSALTTSLQLFQLQNGRFPTAQEGLAALIANPAHLPDWKKNLDRDDVPLDPWNHPYIYRAPAADGRDFDLLSAGPDGQIDTADDVHNVDR